MSDAVNVTNLQAGDHVTLTRVAGRHAYRIDVTGGGAVWWAEPFVPDSTGANWPGGAKPGDFWLVTTTGAVYELGFGS